MTDERKASPPELRRASPPDFSPAVILAGRRARIAEHCKALVKELGLTKGSIEIHCHEGQPKQVDVLDKSLKFEDEQKR